MKPKLRIPALLLSLILLSVFLLSCNIFDVNPIDIRKDEHIYTITLSYDSFKSINMSYATGNYGNEQINGIQYGYYRTAKDTSSKTLVLLPFKSQEYIESLPGSFYNVSKLGNIISIEITYKASDKAYVNYGNNTDKKQSYSLPASNNGFSTIKVETSDSNFFSICSGESKVYIRNITIQYTNRFIEQSELDTYLNYRINPVVFSGKPKSGSTVTVPNKIDIKNGEYEVVSYRTYTYYSMDDIIQNPALAKKAALTDPVDIAYYSIAFGTFPVNYVAKEDYADAYEYFGSDTRCFFEYSRKNGYVKSVPFKEDKNFVYYELDIALDKTYNASSRGVGRLVFFKYGFDGNDYDSSPVVLFTDDHYSTFCEFDNCGSLLNRFDGNLSVMWITHDSVTIIENN